MQRFMLPIAVATTSAITSFLPALAFAEAPAEAPMETVGKGGVASFVVLLIVLVGVYVWFTARATKKERAETARQAALNAKK